jgi:uncharacterized protein (DUF1810 family)
VTLTRFKDAQDEAHGGFATALAELRAGRKASHWIWYIFPQLAGLGWSSMAQRYAIRDRDEAYDYLRDPILRERLHSGLATVADQLERGSDLESLMGGAIDAMKLMSCVTLFREIASAPDADWEWEAVRVVCATVLAQAERQGHRPCEFTLRQVGSR